MVIQSANVSESLVASPAVMQAISICEAIAASPSGLTLTELSTQLDLPKNAVFRIMRTLQATGYAERHNETFQFSLTTRFLKLGQPRVQSKSLVECASTAMHRLRDEFKETVQLGVRSGDGGVIIEVVDGLYPLRIAVELGLSFPLHNNAPGKCLLAELPLPQREELIARLELVASTPATITRPDRLLKECQRVQSLGFATDHGEADEGIHCVAAPIFDRHRHCVATVWISGPSRRLPAERFSEAGVAVKRAASEITAQI